MDSKLRKMLEQVENMIELAQPLTGFRAKKLKDILETQRADIHALIAEYHQNVDLELYIDDRIRQIEKTTPWLLYDYIDPENLFDLDHDDSEEDD